MNQNHIGPLFFDNSLNFLEDIAGNIKESLTGTHDCQIMIWHDIEDAKNLFEHLAVLTRHANNRLKFIWSGLQLINERTHLDCLRPRPEDKHHLFRHDDSPYSISSPQHAASSETACYR